jgi:hypothetical protein
VCGGDNSSCTDCADSGDLLGDLNGDGGFNILDIVTLANCIVSSNCLEGDPDGCRVDINEDGIVNILDLVQLVYCVLEQNCN